MKKLLAAALAAALLAGCNLADGISYDGRRGVSIEHAGWENGGYDRELWLQRVYREQDIRRGDDGWRWIR